ncbi:hypothetical protein [Streptomyces sp. NPDC001282]|uniref:hypothetical protein n=1 Tax=Streptomyces sp. NPDC001282 TaxID=3364557 RepID=UPI0036A26651
MTARDADEFDRTLRLHVGPEPGLPLPYDVLAHALATQPGEWTGARAVATLTAAGLHTSPNDAWGLLRHLMLRA